MKFYSILVVTLGAANYATADNDGINMLRGMLPHLKKMKDDAGVVDVLANCEHHCRVCGSCEEGLSIVDKTSEVFSGLGHPHEFTCPHGQCPHCCDDDKEEGALSLIEEVISCGVGDPCDPNSNKPHCCPNPNPNGPSDICMTHAPEGE